MGRRVCRPGPKVVNERRSTSTECRVVGGRLVDQFDQVDQFNQPIGWSIDPVQAVARVPFAILSTVTGRPRPRRQRCSGQCWRRPGDHDLVRHWGRAAGSGRSLPVTVFYDVTITKAECSPSHWVDSRPSKALWAGGRRRRGRLVFLKFQRQLSHGELVD